MSLKMRALLSDDYRSKIEQSYMTSEEFVVLHDVPCEMLFESSGGWLEFESEQHSYLPLFHIAGHVKSITGNFPYNVSTLTFSDQDMQKLQKDVLYYMNPDELAHMIQVGRFFTDQFKLPEILVRNDYRFPCLVDLTVIPPSNPLAYENMTYTGGVTEDSVGGIGKDNLPVFYIGFKGTGINRKKDPLLDYYGINFDEDFPVYALTAESSGYTDPPLMEYITEPIEEAEEVMEAVDEMYMDDEELIPTEEVKEETDEFVHAEDDKVPDLEDVIVAEADRRIERRVNSRRQLAAGYGLDTQQERQDREVMDEMIRKEEEASREAERRQEEMRKTETALDKLTSLQQMLQAEANRTVPNQEPKPEPGPVAERVPVSVSERESESTPAVTEYFAQEQPEVSERQSMPVEERSVSGVDVTDDAKRLTQPDHPQQMKEILMDLNPEKRETVEEKRAETTQMDAGLEKDERDAKKLSDVHGADVSDTRLQAKIDEAKIRSEAVSASVDQQQKNAAEKASSHSHKEDRADLIDFSEVPTDSRDYGD